MEACRADFYALRAFLDDYFSDKPGFRATSMLRGSLNPKCYIFTWAHGSAGGSDFSMRRVNNIFSHYDVLNFYYTSEKIEVKKGELRTEQDHNAVKGLVAILEQKPYGQFISNLDELKL